MIELAQSVAAYLSGLDWLELGARALWALGGGALSLLAAYLVLIKDVSYIKGVVDQLHSNNEQVQGLRRDVDLLLAREVRHGHARPAESHHEPAVGLR